MQVHPTKWDEFSAQVVESTKLSFGDNANAWATGILSFTMFPHPWHMGRNQSRRLQERRVKTGLGDASEGVLGDVLQTWNEGYFQERGLVARLELSEEAVRSPNQQSPLIAGEAHWHLKKEDRDRHRQERKLVLIVATVVGTPVEEPGALQDLFNQHAPSELGSEGDVKHDIAEALGDLPPTPVELPGDSKRAEVPGWNQYAELEANNAELLKNGNLRVTADNHAKLHKELNPIETMLCSCALNSAASGKIQPSQIFAASLPTLCEFHLLLRKASQGFATMGTASRHSSVESTCGQRRIVVAPITQRM